MRHQAGVEIKQVSTEIESTTTLQSSTGFSTPTTTTTDVGGMSNALAYNLEYCHPEGYIINLGADYILSDETGSVQNFDQTRTGIEIEAFFGYEW